jgi:hypothetical protein
MAVRLIRRSHFVACFALAALFACASSSSAEGFRIETKVFVGDAKEPASETTTLFQNGVVYDFIKKSEQIAVFRKPGAGKAGQFTLMNEMHSIQTSVSTEQLASTMTRLKGFASTQKDPFLRFAANPEFDEEFNDDTGQLKLTSHLVSYTVDTMPSEHPDETTEYREFLDWFTQLDALLSGGGIPPEPRLRLNAVLARRKVIPIKVQLVRAGEDPVHAEHAFTWRLSQDDIKRIDDVRANLTKYRKVDNEHFNNDTKPREKGK